MRLMNRAVVYLITATSLFSIINVGVKYLQHLPASELVFFRALIAGSICATLIWKQGGRFLGKNKSLLFFRGLFGTMALFALFFCLQHMPLAVAMTLINLAPILTVAISHIYLGEKASLAQWLLLLFSFVGVVMVRGVTDPVPWPLMGLGLFAAFFAALAYVCVRKLRLTEDPMVVVLYFPLVTLPFIGPVAFYQWVPPQGLDWLILLAIGGLTHGAQYFLTLAYQMETAAKVMIFNYTGLFWGVLLGWTLFNERLGALQLSGVFLVFLCLCGNYWVSWKGKNA